MNNLLTKWANNIDTTSYPRPQMVRDSYQPLDGQWDIAILENDLSYVPDTQTKYTGKILVPFAPESVLSGVNHTLKPNELLVYHTTFNMQEKDKVALLHFGAVDYECKVYLNDICVGEHIGGYTPFEIDISDYIQEHNNLCVCVVDPSDTKPISRGKQKFKNGGIWYSPTSGIWQSVWIEYVPATYISNLKITPDIDSKSISIEVTTNKGALPYRVILDGKTYDLDDDNTTITLDDVILWSPDNPHLYYFDVICGQDKITSYFAMRKFSVGVRADGKHCFMLNNAPYFMSGLLDQGYWSDGLYTAPNDDALIYDILLAKECGFNTLRKHIKLEPLRWYYHCDRLGMIVWQDFVNGGGKYNPLAILLLPNIGINIKDNHYGFYARKDKIGKDLYYKEMREVVDTLYNCPCIALWTPFNEGWGQFDSVKVTKYLRTLDNSRIIDSTSGWSDQGGKLRSIHKYFVPFKMPKKETRPVILSEFGGYSMAIEGHKYSQKVFGYAKYDDKSLLEKDIQKLWQNELLPAKQQGLCASIYTQLSDVQTEVNGIVTYDREVVKISPKLLKELNDQLINQ